jgi:DME family drug/metabolite transporter
MIMRPISYKTGVLLVLTAGFCWSGIGTAVRILEDVNIWLLLFYRSLGMVPVLFIFLLYSSNKKPFEKIKTVGYPGIVGGLCLITAFAGGIHAMQSTTIANAAFLFATAPFFTAVLAWPLLKEPVRTATWWCISIALIGIAIMVQDGLELGQIEGNFSGLVSAIGFAGFTITLRWGKLSDMVPAVVLGGVFALAFSSFIIISSGSNLAIDPIDALVAMGTGAILLAGGMLAYTIGSRVVVASDLAVLSMVEVVLAPVWVWLILSEAVGISTMVGGVIIITALIANAMSGLRHKPTKLL